MKQYTFTAGAQEITLEQGELKLKDHLALVKLLNFDLGQADEVLKNPQRLIAALAEKDFVYDFIRVITHSEATNDELAEMPDSVVWEVVADFFSFNGKLIGMLKGLLSEILSGLTKAGMATISGLQSRELFSSSQMETLQSAKPSKKQPLQTPSAGQQ